MDLGQLLDDAARRSPQKPALLCGEQILSYQSLNHSVTCLAQWLLREGLRPGDRVAIYWSNSVEAVEVFFACFRAGLIAVPINTRLKAGEVAYILAHSKAVLCFSEPALAPLAESAGADCPSLKGLHTAIPVTALSAEPLLPAVDADQPAVVLYTSGTTARPKGVTHTHRSLLASAELMRSLGVGPDQVVLMMTPLVHASGLMCDLLPAVLSAAPTVLAPAFDPGGILDLIEHHHCTYTIGLPAMMQFLVEEQSRRPRQVSSLRMFAAGGDTVPVNLQERFQAFFGIPLQEGYGMTESVPLCFNRPPQMRPGALGRLVEGVAARVVDLFGDDVPPGETGEFAVRSPANCVGYWDDPQATAAALRDGWLHTGDLVRCDPDGYFWFEGRKKEIIIRGGSNISPQEVEEVLYQHPAVLEAGVVGLPDPLYGEQPLAFVSLRPGRHATERQLRDFARERLADYKVPVRIQFLAELPKNVTGKVQRRALKDMALSQPDPAEQGVVARV